MFFSLCLSFLFFWFWALKKKQKTLSFFPNSVSLGSSVIVKIPEQVGAAKSGFPTGFRERFPFPREALGIRTAQGWEPGSEKRFPTKVPKVSKQGSQEQAPKKGFPARGSQARFQEQVPKQVYQEQIPKQGLPASGSQQVPKQGFLARGSQARFPGTGSQARFSERRSQEGSQARFPGKGIRKRLQGFPMFSGRGSRQGSQEVPSKVPRNRSQARRSQAGSQARVPRKRFPSKVLRNRFCKHGFQEPFSRFPGNIS